MAQRILESGEIQAEPVADDFASVNRTALAADIPSLDRLLNDSAFAAVLRRYSRTPVTAALREALAALRQQVVLGELTRDALAAETIASSVETRLQRNMRPRLRSVFNLTGTVLHTNFGRALLPSEVQESVL